mmetsp:Transcript_21191/g.53486  ORF Transcript_21191/g.53486 Transcript_21191/m.53486 type:complete len:377 (-) Transcript_21191:240-1370(-)
MALRGIRVLEFGGLAPVPYCGLILADHGADVVRIDKKTPPLADFFSRGKRSIVLDFKKPRGADVAKLLIKHADVLLEPHRPGVMEAIGLGPDVALGINPNLVYARLTGFGQTGPYAHKAGHDINYLSIAGTLSLFGRAHEPPMFPSNIVADFAAGGLMCALGVMAALLARPRVGGQVIDNAMVDGSAYLSLFPQRAQGTMLASGPRGTNMLDGGSPFYEVYETKDHKFMAVGAIEPKFYAELLAGLGLDGRADLPAQMDTERWGELRAVFKEAFSTRTRAEWEAVFDARDACVTPVLEMEEAAVHPHNAARGSFRTGPSEPQPAPRLSKTPAQASSRMACVGDSTQALLVECGLSEEEISRLVSEKIVFIPPAAKL